MEYHRYGRLLYSRRIFFRSVYHTEEIAVYRCIVGKLGVECRYKHIPLARRDCLAVDFC